MTRIQSGFEGVVDPAVRRALLDLRRRGSTAFKIVGTIPTPGPPTAPGVDEGDIIIDSGGIGWSWDGDSWVNIGPIQGPAGPAGSPGPPGPQGPPGTGSGGSGFTFVQDTVPVALEEGDTWWNSTTVVEFSGSSWVAVDEGSGQLVWVQFAPGAGGLSQTVADTLYVNVAGDTMTGVLTIASTVPTSNTLTVKGASGQGNVLQTWKNFANTDLALMDINGFLHVRRLALGDTDNSHYLQLLNGSNLTTTRVLTVKTGDADRLLQIDADSYIDQDVRKQAWVTFTQTISSAAAPAGPSHLTRKDYVDAQTALKVSISGSTMTGSLTVQTPMSVLYVANATGVNNQNPLALVNVQTERWHNLLAFGAYNPTAEQWNGTAWSAVPSATTFTLFDSNAGTGIGICDGTYSAWRCTWSGLSVSYVSQVILAFAYTAANPLRDILIELSVDGTTWVTKNTITGVNWNTFPYTIALGTSGFSNGTDNWMRITVTRTAVSGDVVLMEVKGMTPRWGSQGKGPEAERVYQVDNTRAVTFQAVSPASNVLTTKGVASQTGLLFVARDSAGTALATIDKDGRFNALSKTIYGVATPGAADHAANKAYVDALSNYNWVQELPPTPTAAGQTWWYTTAGLSFIALDRGGGVLVWVQNS